MEGHKNNIDSDIWSYINSKAKENETLKIEDWEMSEGFDEDLFNDLSVLHKLTEEVEVPVVDVQAKKKEFFAKLETKSNTNQIQEKKEVKTIDFKKRFIQIAAAVALVFTTSLLFYKGFSSDSVFIETGYGEHKKVTLLDGSVAWLNASSKISYDKETPRTILLEGEAFFDVVKDKKNPFTVETPDKVLVKALGTSFNVKAYVNGSYSETVLLTGKVEVSSKTTSQKVVLLPNDRVKVARNNGAFIKSELTEGENVLFWKENKIQFKNKSFKEVAEDFENQFNVKLRFENETIANTKFTGAFNKNMPVKEILEVLTITKSFEYTFDNEKNSWIIK